METCNPTSPSAPAAPARWRLVAVMVAALLLAAGQPLAAGLLDEQGSFDVVFSLLIAAVTLLVFDGREHRRLALTIGGGALACIWTSYGRDGEAGRLLLVAAHVLAAGFFGLALWGILRSVLVNRVSGNSILGSLDGYLLLGIIWSLLYCAVETASPGSFRLPAAAADAAAHRPLDRGLLHYFSFITLATVGYGDVTPLSPLARSLAWMEAIAGQFYLAVLVAGLVGFQVTHLVSGPPAPDKP